MRALFGLIGHLQLYKLVLHCRSLKGNSYCHIFFLIFALCSHAHAGFLLIVNSLKANPFYNEAAEFEQGIKDVLSPYQTIKSYMEGNKQP
jgi:hypothetical protein